VRLLDPTMDYVCLGPYKLERLIGCGGMGIVFKARDPELDRPVALKLWNLDAEEAEVALRNEAQCQAQISHPNVVTIYETGKIGDDMYLAMEYVDGKDVRRLLKSHALAWQQILALFIRAGQGLAAVHKGGLVHGDFKPDNILLGRDGRVLVADFGVARAVGEFEHEPAKAKVGGTRVYMAPERLEGRLGNAWSDQFSFCVALWESLHGMRPYAGTNATDLLNAIAVGELRAGPAAVFVPRLVRKALAKGLAADPGERWESMDALIGELLKIPTRLRVRRRVGVMAVAGLVAAGVVGLTNRGERDEKHEIPHEEVGIMTDQPATIEVESGSERPEATITAHIAAGEFDQAIAQWRAVQYANWIRGVSSEDLSLEVARHLHKRAVELAEHSPEAAFIVASYASMIASSVPPEPSVRKESVVAAQKLQAATLELMLELDPHEGD